MNPGTREFSQLAEGERFSLLGVELEKVGPDLARDEHGRPWYMEPHDRVIPFAEAELPEFAR